MSNKGATLCKRCHGAKKVQGIGMIDKICDECFGAGFIADTSKLVESLLANQASVAQATADRITHVGIPQVSLQPNIKSIRLSETKVPNQLIGIPPMPLAPIEEGTPIVEEISPGYIGLKVEENITLSSSSVIQEYKEQIEPALNIDNEKEILETIKRRGRPKNPNKD